MQIAGSDFLFEQNNRLRDSLLDYSKKAAEQNVVANAPAQVSSENKTNTVQPAEETGATLNLSTSTARAVKLSQAPQTSTVFAPTDFSTNPTEQASAAESNNGNSVLNQYRFFVQSTVYEGAEGSVRRIS